MTACEKIRTIRELTEAFCQINREAGALDAGHVEADEYEGAASDMEDDIVKPLVEFLRGELELMATASRRGGERKDAGAVAKAEHIRRSFMAKVDCLFHVEVLTVEGSTDGN